MEGDRERRGMVRVKGNKRRKEEVNEERRKKVEEELENLGICLKSKLAKTLGKLASSLPTNNIEIQSDSSLSNTPKLEIILLY